MTCLVSLTHYAPAKPAPAVDSAIVQSIRQKATANLSKQDNLEYQTILASVLGGRKEATPTDRKRFLAVLDKQNATPPEMSYFLRPLTSGFQYRTDLFRDALVAYKRHAPYRSPKGAADEGFLLAQVAGTPEGQQKETAARGRIIAPNADMIARITSRKPVFLADTGETVVFDESRIKDTEFGTAITQKRLLLTRP